MILFGGAAGAPDFKIYLCSLLFLQDMEDQHPGHRKMFSFPHRNDILVVILLYLCTGCFSGFA